jgi:hypothetical protein
MNTELFVEGLEKIIEYYHGHYEVINNKEC